MKENAGYKYRRREIDRGLTPTMKVAVAAERTTSRRRMRTTTTRMLITMMTKTATRFLGPAANLIVVFSCAGKRRTPRWAF